MQFDYFYREQAEQFVFIRIPMILITDERFSGISTGAKILYGLLLDRVSLSSRNGWVDEEGRVYIIYTLQSIEGILHCSDKTATKMLAELENAGLIERIKHGQGKPAVIYVKNFIPVSEDNFQNRKKYDPGNVNYSIQDPEKVRGNHINNNHTENNHTNLILSGDGYDADARSIYREYLEESLEPEILKERHPYQKDVIDGIFELILDTVCSGKQHIRIAGEDLPAETVRSRFMKLDSGHVEYVLESLGNTTVKIRNIRQYLLTALYNAPVTIGSYYQQEVRHDMAANESNEEEENEHDYNQHQA